MLPCDRHDPGREPVMLWSSMHVILLNPPPMRLSSNGHSNPNLPLITFDPDMEKVCLVLQLSISKIQRIPHQRPYF